MSNFFPHVHLPYTERWIRDYAQWYLLFCRNCLLVVYQEFCVCRLPILGVMVLFMVVRVSMNKQTG